MNLLQTIYKYQGNSKFEWGPMPPLSYTWVRPWVGESQRKKREGKSLSSTSGRRGVSLLSDFSFSIVLCRSGMYNPNY
jgi:hypothetical protein